MILHSVFNRIELHKFAVEKQRASKISEKLVLKVLKVYKMNDDLKLPSEKFSDEILRFGKKI